MTIDNEQFIFVSAYCNQSFVKKRYTILPTVVLLLSPSLLRFAFPAIYEVTAPLLVTLFDIAWLWIVLFSLMLVNWVIRQIRK